jgi:hypothetical protein
MNNSIWRGSNTSGTTFDKPWKWLLLPGVVIQWFLYMFPGGGFGRVVSNTRTARSPLMTYYYSAAFYGFVVLLFCLFLGKK